MASHRLFKIVIEDGKAIAFIPALQKLFLVEADQVLPQFIEAPEDEVVPCSGCGAYPDYRFRATQLIINNSCNLRCIYCYGEFGEAPSVVMQFEYARAAIDRVVADTLEMKFPVFEVNLIGGEPTLEMGLVKQIVRYTREAAAENGLKARIGLVSNGVFGKKTRLFIIENLDYITFSIDGPKDINDLHRPTAGNGSAYSTTVRNIAQLYSSGVTVGIRATISSLNVERLPQVVTFLHELCPRSTIGLELVQDCGRSKSSKNLVPDTELYSRKMIETIVLARDCDIKLKCSTLRFSTYEDHISFCGVNGKNFAITPEGLVTACTRVTSDDHPLASQFVFGRYDKTIGQFEFDDERYRWLQKIEVNNIEECSNCFARHNCKGDCPAVKSDFCSDFTTSCSGRCEAIKAITLGMFKSQLGLM